MKIRRCFVPFPPLSVFLLFLSLEVSPCRLNKPHREVNMAISHGKKSRIYYSKKEVFNTPPAVELNDCGETSRKGHFLMIGTGLYNSILDNSTYQYSYNDVLSSRADRCSLKNSPFQVEVPNERAKKLKERRLFINKCLVVQVTDINKNPIVFPKGQSRCQAKFLHQSSVDMKGPLCFFKPDPKAIYHIRAEVDSNCLDEQYFKDNKLALQDILGILNVYKTSDTTGRSPHQSTLASTKFRLSIDPDSSLMDVSPSYGNRPVWPTSWMGGGTILGKLEIADVSKKHAKLKLPLVVNNRCSRKCIDGLCSSPCDYAQAVTGRYTLYRKRKNSQKYDYLETWFDGSMAPPQWQGILASRGVRINKGLLKPGQVYKIVIELGQQNVSYNILKKYIKQVIRIGRDSSLSLSNGHSINEIPTVPLIGEGSSIPSLPGISELHFGRTQQINRALANSIRSFHGQLTNPFWPPYYEKACLPLEQCRAVPNEKLELHLLFQIEKEDSENQYSITNAQVARRSNFSPEHDWKSYSPPFVKCD